MDRTITHEGTTWRVWVNPAPVGRDSQSGLELVFTAEAGEQRVASPVGRPLLSTLSREGLEVDEGTLREELRRALGQASATSATSATSAMSAMSAMSATSADERGKRGKRGGGDGER